MRSIGRKLWSGMMVLVVCMLALLWLAQVVFLEQFYTRMKVSEVRERASVIIADIDRVDKEELAAEFEKFAYEENLNLELLDSNGQVLFLAGASGAGGQMGMVRNNIRIQAFRDVMSGQEVAVTSEHARFSSQVMVLGLPVLSGGKISGAFLVTMPLAPVTETAAILKKQLGYISVILLAVSLAISFLLSRTLTKPIREITQAAAGLAAGNYEERIAVRGQDEIGKLAETFNYMAAGLAKTEQLRRDLIANVSHELRTPLSLIRGYAETIRDVSGGNEKKREKQLGIIIEETVRLSTIVDDILNLSQLQSGVLELKREAFNIQQMLSGIVKRYEIMSEKTGVPIVADIDEPDLLVRADGVRIEQVLYNLINNAFSHTPAGGSITVRAAEQKDSVRIEVADTGSGIAEEDLQHIWDRYYKAAEPKRDIAAGVPGQTGAPGQTGGSGLGLAIVRAILDAHGGKFGVVSKVGSGTTFWFELEKTGRLIS